MNYENLNFSKLKKCDQLWEEMTPAKNGRICRKCSRIIVDFTDKTNTEIAQIHLKSKTGVCGYYRPAQFAKKKTALIKGSGVIKAKTFFLSAVSYLTISNLADGKDRCKASMTYEQPYIFYGGSGLVSRRAQGRIEMAPHDTVKVTGRVTSQGEAIAGVSILIEGTTIGAATDSEGRFTLWLNELPDSVDTITVIAHFIGYRRAERQLSVRESTTVEINIDEDYSQLSDFIVVRTPWYKRVWWRISKPFRRSHS